MRPLIYERNKYITFKSFRDAEKREIPLISLCKKKETPRTARGPVY